MAEFNEIKERVLSTIGTVADMTKDAAAKTADKAKSLAKIAKITVGINSDKETVKKAYAEIGKLYYEKHGSNPDGFFSQLCSEVSEANIRIEEKEREIAIIKADMNDKENFDGIEVEFE